MALHFRRRLWLLWHRKWALFRALEACIDLLYRLLPSPVNAPAISDDDSHVPVAPVAPSQSVIIRAAVPPYGQRAGWRPTGQEDFGEASLSLIYALRELMVEQGMVALILSAMLLNIHWDWERRRRQRAIPLLCRWIARGM